jgi:hypothetical protein
MRSATVLEKIPAYGRRIQTESLYHSCCSDPYSHSEHLEFDSVMKNLE